METERYKDLPEELYNRFDQLSDEASVLFEKKDYRASFQKYEECLALFPEPKEDYGDYPCTLEWMIDNYLSINDYAHAKKWVRKLRDAFKNQNILGDWDFLNGKVHFESGDYDTAWHSFDHAYHKSAADCFKEQNPKYLDFYRHPEKYSRE